MFSFPDRWGMGELAIRRPGRHYSPPTMPRYHDTISGCVDSNSKIGNRACRSRGTASSRSHEDIKCNVFNFSFMTFSSPALLLCLVGLRCRRRFSHLYANRESVNSVLFFVRSLSPFRAQTVVQNFQGDSNGSENINEERGWRS